MIQLKWPWLGIAIPVALIGGTGYSAHYYVFRHTMSLEMQVFFEGCLSMIWFSYYLAIKTPTGSPPPNYKPPRDKSWKRWCKKCKNYKPERAHHCKTCRKCVLKMDHHCPWTMNCVGFGNMPHFMRFLFWVEFTTSFGLWHFVKRISYYYHNAHLPAYLFSLTELVFVILLTALDFFVLLTITILLIRCIYAIAVSGRTQIEGWEMERVESRLHNEKTWEKMRENYRKIHKKEMPKLKSWTNGSHQDDAFTFDDIVFPYDLLSFWDNAVSSMGPFYLWLWPWGKPQGDGVTFVRNEYAEDDPLGLPWPPDGENQEKEENAQETESKSWMNEFGETLNDFGVDDE